MMEIIELCRGNGSQAEREHIFDSAPIEYIMLYVTYALCNHDIKVTEVTERTTCDRPHDNNVTQHVMISLFTTFFIYFVCDIFGHLGKGFKLSVTCISQILSW